MVYYCRAHCVHFFFNLNFILVNRGYGVVVGDIFREKLVMVGLIVEGAMLRFTLNLGTLWLVVIRFQE